MQIQPLSQEDPLEKYMTIHFSILVCKSPWIEEFGRLQSRRVERVGHDWVTKHTSEFTEEEINI